MRRAWGVSAAFTGCVAGLLLLAGMTCSPSWDHLADWGIDVIAHVTPYGHRNYTRGKDAFTDIDEYKYDSSGRLEYAYNITQELVLSGHYQYDDRNFLRTWTYTDVTHDVFHERIVYQHDNNVGMYETIHYTGVTTPSERYVHTYDVGGRLQTRTKFIFGSTEWIPYSRQTWSYDEKSRMTSCLSENRQDDTWVEASAQNAEYDSKGRISVLDTPGICRDEFSFRGGRIDAVTHYEDSFSDAAWQHINTYEYYADTTEGYANGHLCWDRFYTTYYSDDMDFNHSWTQSGSSFTFTGPWNVEPLDLTGSLFYALDINTYRR